MHDWARDGPFCPRMIELIVAIVIDIIIVHVHYIVHVYDMMYIHAPC